MERFHHTLRPLSDNQQQLVQQVEGISDSAQLRRLLRIDAAWREEDICLQHTRVALIENILNWANDPNSPSIYWLTGLAGSGKSAVANTVAMRFHSQGCLGSSFFFKRGVANRDTADYVFTTFCRDLGARSLDFRKHILNTIDQNDGVPPSLLRQLRGYLLPGLQLIPPSQQLVFVLDAMDECGHPSTRRDILMALETLVAQSPRPIKIFVTSRLEPDLETMFGRRVLSVHDHIDLHSSDNAAGIEAYMNMRMSKIVALHLHLRDSDWPGPQAKKDLVQHAAGLFIWMATACAFLEPTHCDPGKRLHLLLSGQGDGKAEATLDKLYMTALHEAFSQEDPLPIIDFQAVVGSIVTLMNPLTSMGLGTLIRLNGTAESSAQAVERIVGQIQSVIYVDMQRQKPVQTIHPSFADFLTTPQRCIDSRFLINRVSHHLSLASHCFRLMARLLKFDICGINAPTFNSDISDLRVRISRRVPEALQYACRFWADHLVALLPHPEMVDLLRAFFFKHVLHWLEVMSLLDLLDSAFKSVELAIEWTYVCFTVLISYSGLGHIDIPLCRFIASPMITSSTSPTTVAGF
jgi:hypothetical protein